MEKQTADDSLDHVFVICHYTNKIWAEVIKWLGKLDTLSNKAILFGIMDCKKDVKPYFVDCEKDTFIHADTKRSTIRYSVKRQA